MKKENYFENESPEKSFGFKVVLTLVALMILSFMVVRIYTLFSPKVQMDPTLFVEPEWYNISVILLAIVALAGLVATYMYRKIGVYMVCAALFIMVVINPEFNLMRTLLPLFTFFFFVGYGLFEIIPKWRFFK